MLRRMGEGAAIQATDRPLTGDDLRAGLTDLGLRRGETVIVHTALSRLGWVCGGPETVVRALIDVLGPGGTLVMPAQTYGNSEPSNWQKPPVPADWLETIRATMPPFDPATTPTRDMGKVAELFRTWPGAVRSNHPCGSFAARGPRADEIVAGQTLGSPFAAGSPCETLYELDARVLLLGVDHHRNTCLHYAEHLADFAGKTRVTKGSAVRRDGRREWAVYETLAADDSDFAEIGAAYTRIAGGVGRIGNATCHLQRLRPLIDFAAAWMEEHRVAAVDEPAGVREAEAVPAE